MHKMEQKLFCSGTKASGVKTPETLVVSGTAEAVP